MFGMSRSRRRTAILLTVGALALTLPGAASAATPTPPPPIATFQGRDWHGDLGTPSDQTGAVGPDRYFEFTNSGYAIYTRTGVLLGQGTARAMTHRTGADDYAYDVQTNWDPSTGRFYFATIADTEAAPDFAPTGSRLVYGFSKTATPDSADDFCTYDMDFGTYGSGWFPDFPKLGSSGDFMLIGVNAFSLPNFEKERTDLAWISKPSPGSTCPAAPGAHQGVFKDLRDPANADAATNQLFTPVPAQRYGNQDPAGWVVATPGSIYGPQNSEDSVKPEPSIPWIGHYRRAYGPGVGTARQFFLLKVSKGSNGDAVLGRASSLRVPQYAFPRSAPQPGTTKVLDTHDARFSQAVLSYDPVQQRMALWTQHTVFGGAGAEIRWYEVDVNGATVLRKGALSDTNLYYFNGAISSDRTVRPGGESHGGGWALGFNTSSPSDPLRIRVVSHAPGDSAPPLMQTVKTTEGPAVDGSCQVYVYFCRWGDYSAATPDPSAPLGGAGGNVWFTNGYSQANAQEVRGSGRFWWSTWNWAVSVD